MSRTMWQPILSNAYLVLYICRGHSNAVFRLALSCIHCIHQQNTFFSSVDDEDYSFQIFISAIFPHFFLFIRIFIHFYHFSLNYLRITTQWFQHDKIEREWWEKYLKKMKWKFLFRISRGYIDFKYTEEKKRTHNSVNKFD